MLKKIIQWGINKQEIKTLIQVGSLAGKGKTDKLSDFDISVFSENFDFIENDEWLKEIEEHWICIHDRFMWLDKPIQTRLVIFEPGIKVDFAFHELSVLQEMIKNPRLPETYDNGYTVLLDKTKLTEFLQPPTYNAYRVKKPSLTEFNNIIEEFWFESYHVAKYLFRSDLWTVKSRDWSVKKLLLKMLEWNVGAKSEWELRIKNDGKEIMHWLTPKYYNRVSCLFSHFNREESVKVLIQTTNFFSEISAETASLLAYPYSHELDLRISSFINELLLKPYEP